MFFFIIFTLVFSMLQTGGCSYLKSQNVKLKIEKKELETKLLDIKILNEKLAEINRSISLNLRQLEKKKKKYLENKSAQPMENLEDIIAFWNSTFSFVK